MVLFKKISRPLWLYLPVVGLLVLAYFVLSSGLASLGVTMQNLEPFRSAAGVAMLTYALVVLLSVYGMLEREKFAWYTTMAILLVSLATSTNLVSAGIAVLMGGLLFVIKDTFSECAVKLPG